MSWRVVAVAIAVAAVGSSCWNPGPDPRPDRPRLDDWESLRAGDDVYNSTRQAMESAFGDPDTEEPRKVVDCVGWDYLGWHAVVKAEWSARAADKETLLAPIAATWDRLGIDYHHPSASGADPADLHWFYGLASEPERDAMPGVWSLSAELFGLDSAGKRLTPRYRGTYPWDESVVRYGVTLILETGCRRKG
jgi:hypothetical protein